MKTKTKRADQGFTLIELLVVMAIIGVLASISIISVLENNKKAQDKAAQSDVRNFLSLALSSVE